MIFWATYSFLPLIWIKDFSSWSKMYIFLFSGVITSWYIGLYLTSKNDIINALKIVELFSICFGAIAFFEIFTGNYLFLNERNLAYYQDRSQIASSIGFRVPISVFSNPNNYSLFLLFSIFGSLGLRKTKKTRIGRFMSVLFLVIFFFLLLATQSRSGFIGLLLGFVAYGFILLKRSNTKRNWKHILGFVAFLFIGLTYLTDKFEIIETLITFNINASSGSDAIRVNLIRNGIDFILNSFFLGVGLGNIEYYMINHGIYPTGGITNIHNWWMEIFVSSGIFVFAFYIYIYIKNLTRLYKFSLFKTEDNLKDLSIVFFSFLIGFFIASIGSSSLLYNEWIWPVMAILMSSINLYTER